MTGQQQLIVDALRGANDWMSGAALLAAVGSAGGVKTVHVQLHRVRRELGARMELLSEPARGGRGYRLVRWDA